MQKITMVKKVLESGEPCRKCVRVEEMLRARGGWERVDEVLVLRDSEPDSEAARLALQYGVKLAPFFVVRDATGERVYENALDLFKVIAPAAQPDGVRTSKALPATVEEVAAAAEALSPRTPQEILRWGLDQFGEQLALAFSGAEDVALIDMAHGLGLPYRVFCLDTGRLHPDTYRFIERVRAHYGVEVTLLSPDAPALQAFVQQKGLFSFYQDGHAQCCGLRKLEPLRRALEPLRAWVTGQRRDQSPTRSDVQVLELDESLSGSGAPRLKLNPLALWPSARVWQYIRERRVPYNALHDQGFVSIGCEPCTRPLRPGEHERAARWWWEESTQRECGLHTRAR